MKKKKAAKSKAAKMRSLPTKTLSAKAAKGVKGGNVNENVSLSFSKVSVEYKPQRGD
jgi:type VI protein secretion system component Hcp